MSNHVHLLMTPDSVEAASDTMQVVNQRYAQFRNRQHSSSGKLFEQRFHSEPVKDASHLMFCVLYINGNPHGAGLSNSANYQWSTHALHSGHKSRVISDDMIAYDSWYASLGASKRERAEQYKSHFVSYRAGKVDADHLESALRMEPKPAKGRPVRPDGSCAAETNHKYGEKAQ
jgi:putative transposase